MTLFHSSWGNFRQVLVYSLAGFDRRDGRGLTVRHL